ncbi:MAG: response regulator transcription factor [Proteocatella sp.]|nr:response regulator transcription factor [Proteocatella sp.]MBP7913012.1 response regulator transcription factor [Proteocatella sp.]MBP8654581.1 response regulator transcription factor [Proteocatella sp.]MBP9967254.1 response regulator transcription factor [Proteocatella sp.]
MRKKVLVIDDEKSIRDIIGEYLTEEGFEFVEAPDGIRGLEIFRSLSPDLVILDVMMPKMDGWKVCREIRSESVTPVIMLTARGEEYDKLFGFELGADDYMVKPFSPRELIARVKAVLSRGSVNERKDHEIIEIEDLRIDFDARSIYLGEEHLNLTPKEYDLLSFFVKNSGRVFSREQLLNQVWGYEFVGDARTVDTHVKMLRENLRHHRNWIVTSWGVGYKFEAGEK